MVDQLVVFGSGGHAKVVIEAVLARTPEREIILLDDDQEKQNQSILGIRVSGTREQLEALRGTSIIPAVGDNRTRSAILGWLMRERHRVEAVMHPLAIVGRTVQIAEGAFFAAGAIANADARIGAGAIINTG